MQNETHYYILNGTVKKGGEMPQKPCYKVIWDAEGDEVWNDWLSSLQPCEIDESELENVKNKVYTFDNCKADNPIDVTDIVFEKDGKIYFKQPKQVESDAVECNDNNIDTFINKYIRELPKNWRGEVDLYLGMKNAMIEALSYPDKYTIKRNI